MTKKIFDSDWGLLPEELVQPSKLYFLFGNFYGIEPLGQAENQQLSQVIQAYCEASGGRTQWGTPFEIDRVLGQIAPKTLGALNHDWEKPLLDSAYPVARYYHFHRFEKLKTNAFQWYQAASEQKHIKSYLGLAYCYLSGLGVTASESEANRWEAKYHAALGKESLGEERQCYKIAKLFHDLQRQQRAGDLLAHLRLAYCYLHGLGIAQSWEKPFQLCQQVIELLNKKQSDGQRLSDSEGIMQRAAAQLLGYYHLQGMAGITEPSFWKATALQIMGTDYHWQNNTQPQTFSTVGFTAEEDKALEAVREETLDAVEEAAGYDTMDPYDQSQEDPILEAKRDQICEHHVLQLKKQASQSILRARSELYEIIRDTICADYCHSVPSDLDADHRQWRKSRYRGSTDQDYLWYLQAKISIIPEYWQFKAQHDSKAWIFYLQTSGLNLIYEHWKGEYLEPDTRKLAFLLQAGRYTFEYAQWLLSGIDKQIDVAVPYNLMDIGYNLSLGHHIFDQRSEISQLHEAKKIENSETHFLSVWPDRHTLEFLVTSILRWRIRTVLPITGLQNKPGVVDSILLRAFTTVEKVGNVDSIEEEAGLRSDRLDLTDRSAWATQLWFRRQHVLLNHFLKISFYIHEPWIRYERIVPENLEGGLCEEQPYQVNFPHAIRYVKDLLEIFPEYETVIQNLWDRLEHRDPNAIAKPEFFYSFLGGSNYWKRSLWTLLPAKSTSRLLDLESSVISKTFGSRGEA